MVHGAMSIFEIIFISIGLSMDAVAVSMTNGMSYRTASKRKMLMVPIVFGLFQGIMPLFGFFAGSFFSLFISKFSGWITFLILGFIGFKMLEDSAKPKDGLSFSKLTYRILILQAIATSIDAFAIGVGFCAIEVNILHTAPLIALITFLSSFCALLIGRQFGDLLGTKAQFSGGMILIVIGIKSLF